MITIKSISAFSCTGSRPNQEDYIIAPTDTSERIFVLCDGMGGHGHGEIASKTIAVSVHNYLRELNPAEYTANDFQNAVDFALKELVSADTYHDEKAMGTTLVVVAINRMNVLVGHIGDSRCYQFSENGVKKFRSRDHSRVQEAVDAEILTEEEAWSNPNKNILTRCITAKQSSVEIEIDVLQIEDNDCIMLCSDGVTDALRDSQIQSVIVGRPVEDAAEIIKGECEISSHDNFSLILISFSQNEKNPDPSARSVVNEKNDIPAINNKYCPHCGAALSGIAIFCPSCGLSFTQKQVQNSHSDNYTGQEVTFFSRIKNLNPFWFLAGGIFIGCAISAIIFPHSVHSNAQADEAEIIPINDEPKVFESDLNDFMTGMYGIDSINNPNDTVISKQVLQDEYHTFLNKIHKNSHAE